MNMMHSWGRPANRGAAPFQLTQPPHRLAKDFQHRLQTAGNNVQCPPYAQENLLPIVEAAWFFEHPVNAMRINLSASPMQRIQFFSGSAILMRATLNGLQLTSDGFDNLGRASIVTPVELAWVNLMRIARWLDSGRM